MLLARPMVHPDGRAFLAARYPLVEPPGLDGIAQLMAEADAVYGYRPLVFDAALIARSPRLKVIATGGSGVDHVDLAAAAAAGIAVVRPIGVGARAVAEHVVGLMLCLAKKLVWTDRMTRAGRFDVRWHDDFQEISGKTLAIVGYGHIGREVARMCQAAFGMRVIAFGRNPATPAHAAADGIDHADSLAAALAAADIVSVHVPLTPGMKPVIAGPELGLMKPDAWLINTARGGVVDEAALVDALRHGRIAAAAIDVFAIEPAAADHPLFAFDNVVVSPHSAGFTAQSKRRLALAAATGIDAALRGICPAGIVDGDGWALSRAARAHPSSGKV